LNNQNIYFLFITVTRAAVMGNNNRSTSTVKHAGTGTRRQRFANTNDLLGFLELDVRSVPYKIIESPGAGHPEFPFFVPLSFTERMRKRDWYDPLLLQVLPRSEETSEHEGFSSDPVHDSDAAMVPGLLRKYDSRALLLISNACPLHCRFCFRREYPYSSAPAGWESAWQYCDRNKGINEVILSGGDPLCLDPADLEYFTQRVIAIPHVKTLRIHTRVPIADPGRITPAVIDILASINNVKTCIVVIHANHANELSGECSYLLTRIKATGVLLLNQSVLLRGINDSVAALRSLSTALLDHGILPYYLHQLDRVRGAWHFEVEEKRGKEILRELRDKLPGYAVPRYVREVAGEKSKRNLL
jgi:EF-P beta-lysylation protein EpmB